MSASKRRGYISYHPDIGQNEAQNGSWMLILLHELFHRFYVYLLLNYLFTSATENMFYDQKFHLLSSAATSSQPNFSLHQHWYLNVRLAEKIRIQPVSFPPKKYLLAQCGPLRLRLVYLVSRFFGLFLL